MVNIIKSEDIDFSGATAVVSNAQKFIIPVPKFGNFGEDLIYPKDHEKAGHPITDWEGQPIEGKGLVFYNYKDNAVQAVKGDGKGVIIINQVNEEQALNLRDKIYAYQQDPNNLTVTQLKEVLLYAKEALGLSDMYNSDKEFIAKKMTPAMGLQFKQGGDPIEAFGLMKRDDRDTCHAVYVEGMGAFQGPAATPQKFAEGAVIVKQGSDVRLVQPEIFVETYRFADNDQYGFLTHTDPRKSDRPRMDLQFLTKHPNKIVEPGANPSAKDSIRSGPP